MIPKECNRLAEPGADTRIMTVPAPLLCYWIGQVESLQSARPREG
jgi:hypothetical protein